MCGDIVIHNFTVLSSYYVIIDVIVIIVYICNIDSVLLLKYIDNENQIHAYKLCVCVCASNL